MRLSSYWQCQFGIGRLVQCIAVELVLAELLTHRLLELLEMPFLVVIRNGILLRFETFHGPLQELLGRFRS